MNMHTPGPWTTQHPQGTFETFIWQAEPHSVLLASAHGLNREANARLIAAAPELLEAVYQLVQWADCMGGFEAPQWGRARAALAKAKGGAA